VEKGYEPPSLFDDLGSRERVEVSTSRYYCGKLQVSHESLLGDYFDSPNA
jgi:hypothetical protein